MLWKNHKITIIGFGIFALVFCSVFLSSVCFATSVSCDMSSYLNTVDNTVTDFSCNTSSLDDTKQWYYHGSITYSSSPVSGGPTLALGFGNNNGNFPRSSHVFINLIRSLYTFPLTLDYITFDSGQNYHFTNFKWSNSFGYVSSWILNISDSVSFDSSSPTGTITITENGIFDVSNYATASVDVPPEIVEGDYHDDLLKINNSILVCGAICLVLYFFYCIYRMIIKSTGGY